MQSGGSFDVDYDVTNPQQREVLHGEKERQGDYVFTAQETGEYKFCFSNEMSTFADKMVDFEIAVCGTKCPSIVAQMDGHPANTTYLYRLKMNRNMLQFLPREAPIMPKLLNLKILFSKSVVS